MKLKLTIDGKVYEVEVDVSQPEPPHPTFVPPIGQTRVGSMPSPTMVTRTDTSVVTDESKVCRSPLAGTVSRVSVQVGQEIQINDVLMVLEAMKMETVITAPIAGKVARVNVAQGDAVQQSQVLIEFERD